MTSLPFQNDELVRLFEVYTASPDSIGAHLADLAQRSAGGNPLVVATGHDIALYPGGGSPPMVQSYRVNARGFKEVAAISHLGPALSSLARMKELDPAGSWRSDAERLLQAVRGVRAVSSTQLWEEDIAVVAFAGRSERLTAMVDYACAVTERVLERAVADDSYLSAETLRADYLDGPAEGLPVPFNRVMVATFFLTGLDISHRVLTWFDALELVWERAMVVVAGQPGRPTAGVTRESNSVATVIQTASRGRLPSERLLIAPHAPVFDPFDGTDVGPAAALEAAYRALWARVTATSELGCRMFDGYPRFEPWSREELVISGETTTVHEMPTIQSPTDWTAMTTRLRVVLEDPRQLLSGAVNDYASHQLVQHENRPQDVFVPGLDGEPYPARVPHDAEPQTTTAS